MSGLILKKRIVTVTCSSGAGGFGGLSRSSKLLKRSACFLHFFPSFGSVQLLIGASSVLVTAVMEWEGELPAAFLPESA